MHALAGMRKHPAFVVRVWGPRQSSFSPWELLLALQAGGIMDFKQISLGQLLGSIVVMAALPWSIVALADETQVTREQPAKFCLFRFGFGLTEREKSVVRELIDASDGSEASRTAIFDKYRSFCTGQEFRFMASCLSFDHDVRNCLPYLEPN